MRIALTGARGFVGRAVAARIRQLDHEVVKLSAPRINTPARTPEQLQEAAQELVVRSPSPDMKGVDVLINAAGLACPGSTLNDSLVGANALLPTYLALLAEKFGVSRFVHISSAAVYGNTARLDETMSPAPTSPYGISKLLADCTLQILSSRSDIVVYRPTSVHGPGRKITENLKAFAESPLRSVAGRGENPTPQALIDNVAAAAVFLANHPHCPAYPVLHPWEGLTTASLLVTLSGKEPHHLPYRTAQAFLRIMRGTGAINSRIKAQIRRLEMLWFGQSQGNCWLAESGYVPVSKWPLNTNLADKARSG